ncbi:hypothetical protein NP493_47g04026 [Ridgeia piscesae]|uniref:Coiled-coil domain-containing protein 157 n=1 Tax=Ridgeia piscesae TaxID=27915 RepID=A0AAD9PBE8_RIDPI|nr:hypothetical protein NP493_47g04026 [Ridgeia piscesae]
MASLLGSRNCIESLQSDITNLQEAVVDVFSRVGPVRSPSWKYPDKTGCDLDLTQLLDTYDYSDDEEDAQLSHVVLLELVIDRLVLLIQAMSRYVECSLTSGQSQSTSPASSSTSIGLVVKKYWNKMVQLQNVFGQVLSESKKKDRTIADLEKTITKLEGDLERLDSVQDNAGLDDLSVSIPPRSVRTPCSRRTPQSISRDESNKSCQTIETAFVPCEACLRVQQSLQTIGDSITQMCVSQELPSCLAKYRHQMADVEWLTANDIARWSAEQNKDLARATKHLEQLHATIDPLKGDLAKERKKTNDLEAKLSALAVDVKREKEMQTAQQKQFATKMKEVEQELTERASVTQRQKEALERGKEELHRQVEEMKTELRRQTEMLTELEVTKSHMTRELSENQTNRAEVDKLDAEVAKIREKLAEVKGQLEESSKETAREKAKNVSLSKHVESVQGKQDSLLERLDALDRDNEELRDEMGELEEVKDKLEEELEKAEEQRSKLEEQLAEEKELQREISEQKEALEGAVRELRGEVREMGRKLEKAKDQERLLVEYPDLNGPVNTDLTGSGDIVKDMQNQVTANSVRIGLLQQQNAKLQNSISKMIQAQNRPRPDPTLQGPVPIPLWKQSDIVTNGDTMHHANQFTRKETSLTKHQNNPNDMTDDPVQRPTEKPSSNSSPGLQQKDFLVGRAPYVANDIKKGRPKSGSRPPSGRIQLGRTPVSAGNSLRTYQQLRKDGKLKTSDTRKAGWQQGSGTEDASSLDCPMVACPKCDKMFPSPSDLDIHRHYCFGGI